MAQNAERYLDRANAELAKLLVLIDRLNEEEEALLGGTRDATHNRVHVGGALARDTGLAFDVAGSLADGGKRLCYLGRSRANLFDGTGDLFGNLGELLGALDDLLASHREFPRARDDLVKCGRYRLGVGANVRERFPALFGGNDGKTAACVAGVSRLDRGIHREEVRLTCDIINDVDEGQRFVDTRTDRPDVGYGLRDVVASALGNIGEGARVVRSLTRNAGYALDIGGHLLDSAGRALD